MPLKILNKSEHKEILNRLKSQFGINSIPGILAKRSEEKLFIFTGSFNEKQIRKLESCVFIERAGIYFAKIVSGENNNLRLSIEGSQILGNQIKKNIFELNKNQVEKWMKGEQLDIKTGKTGFLIMKHKNDFLGTGKASAEKIGNFIPKNRRLRNKT